LCSVAPLTMTASYTDEAVAALPDGHEDQRYPTGRTSAPCRERHGDVDARFAARSGDAESIRHLLAAGADVNDTLPNGMSALVLATHSGHGAAASALLDRGADPNAAGIGYTALHAAVLRGDVKLVTDLLRHGAKADAQITKGTPLRRNSQDFNLPATLIGATPFWLAAKFVEPEIMQALVAGGADPQTPLPDGTTPLMAAEALSSKFKITCATRVESAFR